MAAVLTLAKKGFPTPWTAAGVAEHINLLKGERVISVSWVDSNTVSSKDKRVASSLEIDGTTLLGTEKVMSKLLVRYAEELGYIDTGVVEWVRFVGEKMAKPSQDRGYVFEVLDEFDHHLAMRSFFVGYTVTAADLTIWGALRQSPVFQAALKEAPSPVGANLLRWYKFVNAMPFAASVMDTFSGSSKASETNKADQGSFDLSVKDLEYGKVCTRFPPEPSGYLHIGHAKAALLNEYIAHTNGGKLLIRFDDTNPTKEKMEYQDAIIADLELLGIKGDAISYTSDYFDVLYDYAIRAINEGIAYVDDTDQKTMQHERMHGIASKSRDLSVEENLRRFEEMKQGTEFGQKCCLRAKMSVDNKNKAMRDPVIYRVNLTPHHRTGSIWKVYPTYDFACPIVDSFEGVTHALRSNEYTDREPQYRWFLKALNLRSVHIEGYSRVNFVYTLLSKRKLQWFVSQGRVEGWDDPRFPTVRGIVRRGLTIEALREYMLSQGASKNNMLLEWDKLWALNKKVIDPKAPRHTAVLSSDMVTAKVANVPNTPFTKEISKHKKNAALGTKFTSYTDTIVLDQYDAASFEQDEEITLMDWGNVVVKSIERGSDGKVTGLSLKFNPEGNVKSTKKKVTWLALDPQRPLVDMTLLDFDYLINKKKIEEDDDIMDFLTEQTRFETAAVADPNCAELKKGDVIQLERKGFYIVDRVAADSKSGKIELIFIPDGKAKSIASKASGNSSSK